MRVLAVKKSTKANLESKRRVRREEFSFLSNSITCWRAVWGFDSSAPIKRGRQFTPPNEIISRRLRVTAARRRLGVSTRIAARFTCAVRQSTRRSMKIKGRKRGFALRRLLFVRTDNRIRSSVCARHGQIVVQVG